MGTPEVWEAHADATAGVRGAVEAPLAAERRAGRPRRVGTWAAAETGTFPGAARFVESAFGAPIDADLYIGEEARVDRALNGGEPTFVA